MPKPALPPRPHLQSLLWFALLFGVACAREESDDIDEFANDSCAQNEDSCPRDCYRAWFNEHAYLFCSDDREWRDARRICQGASFELTRVESEEENDWLRQTADRRDMHDKNLWLGGDDRDYEGSWMWPDGNEFWQGGRDGEEVAGLYENWRDGQPDSRDEEDCLEILGDGRWNDNECEDEQPFICEDYMD